MFPQGREGAAIARPEPSIDVLATIKERFYGTGKTAEDMFDRYRYLVAESSTGKLIDSAEEELFVIESMLRSFLKGWQLP